MREGHREEIWQSCIKRLRKAQRLGTDVVQIHLGNKMQFPWDRGAKEQNYVPQSNGSATAWKLWTELGQPQPCLEECTSSQSVGVGSTMTKITLRGGSLPSPSWAPPQRGGTQQMPSPLPSLLSLMALCRQRQGCQGPPCVTRLPGWAQLNQQTAQNKEEFSLIFSKKQTVPKHLFETLLRSG